MDCNTIIAVLNSIIEEISSFYDSYTFGNDDDTMDVYDTTVFETLMNDIEENKDEITQFIKERKIETTSTTSKSTSRYLTDEANDFENVYYAMRKLKLDDPSDNGSAAAFEYLLETEMIQSIPIYEGDYEGLRGIKDTSIVIMDGIIDSLKRATNCVGGGKRKSKRNKMRKTKSKKSRKSKKHNKRR